MLTDFREIWRYRELLFLLVRRDLKVRYKNSILGFAWSFLNPLIQVLTITLVFQFLMGDRIPSMHVYFFCAMLPWTFFSTAAMDACASLLMYYNLIRRTYFPREIVQLSSILANLIHLGLGFAVFIVYITLNSLFWLLWHGRAAWPVQATVLLLPIPVLGLALLVTGVSMFLSVWTLQFEDVRFITDSVLKILYWAVPVVYFTDQILHSSRAGSHQKLIYTLYMLNPLACFISVFRKLTLPPTVIMETPSSYRTTAMTPSDWGFLAVAMVVSALIAWAGFRFFSSRKWKLAERP
jgi:lipopolysaccharide transport system permease protein